MLRLLPLALAGATLLPAPQSPDLPPVPGPVRDALVAGDGEAALTALVELEAEAPGRADLWAFLRGRALEVAGREADAAVEWARFEEELAASPWRHKALFGRAELLRGLRDYEAAEAIYERGVEELRAEGRRRELASAQLEAADALSMPRRPGDLDELDLPRAFELYTRSLELDLPADLLEHARFRRAWCQEQRGEHADAAALHAEYLAAYDAPGAVRPRERRPEALVGLGRALVRQGRVADGRRRLEEAHRRVIAALTGGRGPAPTDASAGTDASAPIDPGDDPRRAALRELAGTAWYEAARTWIDAGGEGALLGVARLRRFLADFPDHPLAPEAGHGVAAALRGLGRADEALEAYDALLARPLPQDGSREALEDAARLAQRALFEKGLVLQEQGRLEDAIGVFTAYTRAHSSGPDWSDAQRRILECEYALGSQLAEAGRLPAAREAWTGFLERHPLDERAPLILFDVGRLYAQEAGRADEVGEAGAAESLYRQAVAQWERLVEKHPGSDHASRALYEIGFVQETRLDELVEAIETYRRCTFGPSAGAARERLVSMTRETLEVVTERAFHSDEPARVRVWLRNVESLEVSLHRLDLEAYFRKHLTHEDVEDLDLDLIAPDESFRHEVEGYRDHAWIERELEIPVEGPGVWVVALSTEEHRATTLLVRSDLHVIAKSSRRQVFVHALDARRDEPAEGVRVLVALPPEERDRGATFVELTTGPDGVAALEAGRDLGSGEVGVLALLGEHAASTGVDLTGLSTTGAPSPRRLVYTSRPAYRPGDEVRWRALLRDLPPSEGTPRLEVTIRDSQGRRILAESAAPGAFGTTHGSLVLDALAPTGEYTITVRDERGGSVGASFRVERYRLETVELSVDFERPVYFRGEELVARVEARHYYGAPVADAPLTAWMPDGSQRRLRTDAEGRAELRFPAPDRVDEAPLDLRVQLDALGLAGAARTFLALRAYRAELELERELVLAGDRFTVRARTRTPDGEPIGRELRLSALRRVEVAGRSTLRPAAERVVVTDAVSGEGLASFALEEGGWYTLRLEGTDRFGNPIATEQALFVSGDEDETRLRVLSDAEVARVGEPLVVDVHNRAGAGLALVTVEAERVLDHRVVRLAEGHNRVELPVEARHYPNVVVAAAAVRPGAFHEAAADFEVERELRVRVLPERGEYSPGEEAVVRLEVTDALGSPVEAELSLAVVDEALYATFPDLTPDLREVFSLPRRRWAALATSSSSPFYYAGDTREIAAEVLAETRRLEAEERWRERRTQTLEGLAELERSAGSDDFFLGQGAAPGAPAPEEEDLELMDVIGIGGGAGGKFGARFGGKRSLRARGGLADGPSPSLDADAAFWTPSVVTDAEGRAAVRFPLPDRSTRWRLTSRGIDAGDSAGEAVAHLVTRAPFFVELDAPESLTEGDRPGVLARVHDAAGAGGVAELTLEVRQGELAETRLQRVELTGEVTEVTFLPLSAVSASGPLELRVRCAVERAGARLEDEAAAGVPVRPFGVEVTAAASGELATAEVVELALEGVDAAGRVLEVHVGPRLSLELVHAALDGGPLPLPTRCVTLDADAASDLVGVAGVLERLEAEGLAGAPLASRLRARGRALAARLVATQRGDGGWAWSAGGGDSHLPTTCRATEALARARGLGLLVEAAPLDRAREHLRGRYTALAVSEDELKAMVVHALAASGEADFAAANRLHRLRESLSPAALVFTTRALAAMDRAAMAREVADVLARRADELGRWDLSANLPWNRADLELRALALLALMEARGDSELAARLAAGLRADAPWFPARARGVVIDALARHEGGWRWDAERARVAVRVDGAPVGTVEVGGIERGEVLRLALPADAPSPTRVAFEVEGGAAPRYTARLTGLSREFERSSAAELRLWPLPRQRAAAPVLAGRELPTGFQVVQGLSDDDRWVNTVTRLARGERLEGEVSFGLDTLRRSGGEPEDHLVLEVPLPAGAELVEGSLRGAPAGTEVRDGVLIAPYGALSSGRTLRYALVATRPGSYRVGPPVLRSLYRPERIAVGRADELTVLDAGEASGDAYRATPDELYHRGVALDEAGRDAEAREALSALHEAWGDRLREEPLRDTAERLLFLSIRAGDATDTVRYFEVLREKNPELVVPVEEVLAVGRAYRELGEFERALLVFRAVLEESFGKDLKVAGALEEQGEFLRAVDVLERLWLEYPDSTSTRAASLGFAEKLLARAPTAHEDPALRRAGVDRAALTLRGVLALQRFLALHADDPLAPEAALGLVNAWLELEDHARVATFAAEMAGRFEDPRYVDTFRYSSAVARWYLGEDGAAEALLEAVAGSTFVDPGGVRRRSENRELSLYILAQISHARREFERAMERYELVEDEFSDAREVLEEFRARRLELPEVTETALGAPTRLELAHAGVEELRVLAYRVDLMTLYLREKNLSEVASVDLAGISPSFELAARVERALAPERRTTELELALEEPGAYLVLCTGGGLHTSGLVLVSDLELRVSEDEGSGRVRVTAVERGQDAYCAGVDVRVIGSDSGRFVRGETDRRGLFVADGLVGVTTVIARRGEAEYAFHRGRRPLGLVDRGRTRDAAPPTSGGMTEYFKNVRTLNTDNVLGRTQQLQEEIQRKRKGVQVQQVK